jgi:GMP synthase-like glutamine amidotransferase
MTPRVLLVDNAIRRFLFRPAAHWRQALGEVPSDTVHLPSGQPIPDLGAYTHVILTGSEASILEPKPWFDVEARLIRQASNQGLAILGSCFGHQMLVYALSGAQYLIRSPRPEVGWVTIDIMTRDPLFAEVPNPWPVFTFHFDEVSAPPPPWRVLARSAACGVHAIRFDDQPIWGLQPHPEISEHKAQWIARIYLLLYGRAKRRMLVDAHRPRHTKSGLQGILEGFLASTARS